MPDWEELKERSELAAKWVPKKIWEGMDNCNKITDKYLSEMWHNNIRANINSGLFKEHGTLRESCQGSGFNKALIAIGAGPSYNKNKDVLKDLSDLNLQYNLDEQPFIFVASNHQFKTCVNDGIYPHFVILIDGSDAVYDQLCKDIPKHGHHTILITGLHCNNKVLTDWSKQGRLITFYLGTEEEQAELFTELTDRDPKYAQCEHGGNCLNMAWVMGMRFFKSSVFMCVGNDLSFELSKDYKTRKMGYYADGDYTSNIASKRDEARQKWAWMGYENLRKSPIMPDRYVYDLKPVATTFQFYTYKMWLESQVLMNSDSMIPFHYFNCSEEGTLGVMAKDISPDKFEDKDNWTLLDEVIPKRWHTWPLADAAEIFLQAREAHGRKVVNDLIGV